MGSPRSAVKDTVTIHSQNSRGLPGRKLEELLATMKKKNIFAWCLQETWRLKLEELDHHDTGCITINHGLQEKDCRRGRLGVMIVLSPLAKAAYERGGCRKKTYGLRIVSVRLVLEDAKDKIIKIKLVSAYAPTSNATDVEKQTFKDHLRRAVMDTNKDEILVIGADINASCGTNKANDKYFMDKDTIQRPVGAHGIAWVNKEGEQMLTFCGLNNLCMPKSFFQKKFATRGTWMHPRSNKMYEIDQFLMKRGDLKRVVDCGTSQSNSLYSDHTAIFIKIRLAKGLQAHKKPKVKRFSRDRLKNEDTLNAFLAEVEKIVTEEVGDNLEYDSETGISTQEVLQQAFHAAEEAIGSTKEKRNPGWFKLNQVALQKLITERNTLATQIKERLQRINRLLQGRNLTIDERIIRKVEICTIRTELKGIEVKFRLKRKELNRKVRQAKLQWVRQRVDALNGRGGHFIGDVWKAALEIAGGPDQKHRRIQQSFRDPLTKQEAATAERSGEILAAHLEKLLNAVPSVQDDKIESVQQRSMRHDLNAPPSSEEIIRALRRQNPGKATGDSKIPAEYYKLCETSPMLKQLFVDMIQRIWKDEEPIPKEWLEGRIKMLPKSGDLLDPGRWRSITLLDAAGKIMCTILTNRLNKILASEGLEMQNGFSPGRGTIDGSFCVRTMLKKRKEHGLETWAYFLDLVKAFDTVPRVALLKVLGKFGVPDQMVSMIRRMLSDNIIKLQVQKMSTQENDIMEDADVSISATAGVPQGNSMSPVLFIFYIQAVLETLDDEFVKCAVDRDKPTFRYKMDHVIHGRRWDARRGVIDMEAGESLYADDAAFLFTSRKSLCECAVIIDRHFTAFGLQVHRGKPRKKSKTECMYFPPAGVRYEDADTSNVPVDGGFYHFCKRFKYLGSIITPDLKADADVKTRIRCASHAFNLMRNVLRARKVKMSVKATIYKVIVVTVLLYGSECWAMRQDLLDKLEKFHNQCVRTMCNITLYQQWRGHIRNRDLRKRFMTNNRRKGGTKEKPIFKPLGTIEDMLTERNLRWAGHVARMKENRLPRILLTAHVRHKRPLGRPEQTFAHGLKRSLNVRIRQIHEHLGPGDRIGGRNAYDVANALRFTGNLSKPVKVDCTVITGREPKLGLDIAEDPLEVTKVKTQAARDAGIRVGDYLVSVGGRKVKTGHDVRDAVRETCENGEIRCRFHRRHVEGEDTWIDIAKRRELWTDLVYELFHNAKDY